LGLEVILPVNSFGPKLLTLSVLGDLAIHCAILSKPEGKRTVELIRYLIEAIPQSIETPSKEGWTPLLLAFSLNRFHAAQVLIEAGANQRRRDKLGRNIMHLAFADINEDLKSQTVEVKKMIELTDRRAVQELSVERCTVDPGALTPLGRWLYCLQRRFDSDLSAKRDVLELILGLSDGADLEMMDGSGQLPLHVAVKASYHKLVSCIIERNPALLYRRMQRARHLLSWQRRCGYNITSITRQSCKVDSTFTESSFRIRNLNSSCMTGKPMTPKSSRRGMFVRRPSRNTLERGSWFR
jgi:hypothetical protein